MDRRERWFYVIFFAGVGLTGLGSAWYHLAPDNGRLVWDRLPMTLGFMGILAAVVAERVRLDWGLRLLPLLLAPGLGSVLLWHWSEQAGAGDLRLYLLVQFYPIVAIPLLLALFPARYTRGEYVLAAAVVYGGAKVLEALDARIFAAGGLVSGHTLKHLVAAGATYLLLRMLAGRTALGPSAGGSAT